MARLSSPGPGRVGSDSMTYHLHRTVPLAVTSTQQHSPTHPYPPHPSCERTTLPLPPAPSLQAPPPWQTSTIIVNGLDRISTPPAPRGFEGRHPLHRRKSSRIHSARVITVMLTFEKSHIRFFLSNQHKELGMSAPFFVMYEWCVVCEQVRKSTAPIRWWLRR